MYYSSQTRPPTRPIVWGVPGPHDPQPRKPRHAARRIPRLTSYPGMPLTELDSSLHFLAFRLSIRGRFVVGVEIPSSWTLSMLIRLGVSDLP